MTRLFSAQKRNFVQESFRCETRCIRARATRAKKLESSFGTTPLRLFIYIARYIYRSLHRATSLLAHIFRITRRVVSYARFTRATSCIKLINIVADSVVYRFSSCIYFLCRLIYLCVRIMFARANSLSMNFTNTIL